MKELSILYFIGKKVFWDVMASPFSPLLLRILGRAGNAGLGAAAFGTLLSQTSRPPNCIPAGQQLHPAGGTPGDPGPGITTSLQFSGSQGMQQREGGTMRPCWPLGLAGIFSDDDSPGSQ
ncbi:hypothetical protein VULLAG_LOCUS21576 [Vulpes lagopus]